MAFLLALEYPRTWIEDHGRYDGTYLTLPERMQLVHDINTGCLPSIPVFGGRLDLGERLSVFAHHMPVPPIGIVSGAVIDHEGNVLFSAKVYSPHTSEGRDLQPEPGWEFAAMTEIIHDPENMGRITHKRVLAVEYRPRHMIDRWDTSSSTPIVVEQ